MGLGPLTRCLAVAREAQKRGHAPVFLCKKSFARIVEQFGFTAYLAPEPRHGILSPSPYRLSDVALELGWVEPTYVKKAIDREREVIRLFRPDLIFTETQFSVAVSAPSEHVPWVAAASWADHPKFTSPLYDDSQTIRGMEAPFNETLRLHNLPPVGDLNELAYLRADLMIAPTIPELQPELSEMGGVRFVGYLLSPDMEDGPLPPEVNVWDKTRPVVYVYMSPGDIGPDQWIQTIANAFASSEYSVMVTLSPLAVQPKRIPQIPNVGFFKTIPGSTAIRRADLVITHGGGNTVTNALLFGKPMMIYSHLYAERDYNGRAVERLGAGHNFRTETFRPKDLLSWARQITSQPSYSTNAQKLGRSIRQLGGSSAALALMEQLV